MKRLLVVVLMVAAAGCTTYGGMRDANRQNIARLEPGMSKSQVVSIMGTATASGMDDDIQNPYRREMFSEGQDSYEVYFYYTDRVGYKSIETGLTPVVFRNGSVSGVGWSYYDRLTGTGSTVRMR